MKAYRKLVNIYFNYCRRKTEKAAQSYLRKNRDLNDLITGGGPDLSLNSLTSDWTEK
jgi:hypothetical protein